MGMIFIFSKDNISTHPIGKRRFDIWSGSALLSGIKNLLFDATFFPECLLKIHISHQMLNEALVEFSVECFFHGLE
jgi:hypothetical protein